MFRKCFQLLGLLMLLLIMVVMTSCGGSKGQQQSESQQQKAPTQQVIFTTGSPDAAAYAMGASWSKIIADTYPEIQMTVRASGGGKENSENLVAKRVEFGVLYGPELMIAWDGKGEYQGREAEFRQIRGVLAFPYGAFQMITLADSGIKVISDLKGKRVSFGAPGSTGASYIWPNIVKHYGITKDKRT